MNSAAFTASYDSYRRGRTPQTRTYELSVDAEIKKDIDEIMAGLEQMKQAIASMPPAEQEKILAKSKEAIAMMTSPEMMQARREALEAERAQASGNDSASVRDVEERTPADPQKLFAQRLREFLDVTADVNFSARMLSLTGGFDGIELVDRADRRRHWIWQQAAIVGPDATAAARAAAQAWLKEIER